MPKSIVEYSLDDLGEILQEKHPENDIRVRFQGEQKGDAYNVTHLMVELLGPRSDTPTDSKDS